MRPEQVRGDLVSAAAVRKKLDDLVVCKRNDKDSNRDPGRKVQAEMRVTAERKKRLLRAIARRRETVRAEAYPCEESDERDMLSSGRIKRVERRTGNCPAQCVRD